MRDTSRAPEDTQEADDAALELMASENPEPRPPRSPRWLLIAAWALPIIVILSLAWLQLRAQRSLSGGSLSVADFRARAEVARTPAPDFTLPILGGSGDLSLSSFRGSVVVVNFWASWCGPCREEAPDLAATSRAYRSRGVRFLGIDERDDDPAALAFVREFDIPYPSVVDPAGALADDYRLLGLPTTVVVDPGGQIVYRFTGYLDAPILRSALDDVLAK